MRSVLDTNVLVSGLLSPHGPCAQIIELVIEGVVDACVAERLPDEYDRVLHRRRLAMPTHQVQDILDLLRRSALHVSARPLSANLPDPDDLPFVEVASVANAVLITGNKRHYPRRHRGRVKVLNPREALDKLRE